MDKGGQSLSATEFSTLTGVSRERLRTWERRHGFPQPIRAPGGRRRYSVSDVARVVAVRHAVENGVPIPDAVSATEALRSSTISDGARAALAHESPVAIVALSGPYPLRFEYVNAVVRARPGAPQPGDELLALAPWFENEPGHATILKLFAGEANAGGCRHPDWTAGMTGNAESVAYRLPHEPGSPALVALMGVDTTRERRSRERLEDAEAELSTLHDEIADQRRMADAVVAVTELLRARAGMSALAEAAALLARRVGAVDSGLAPAMSGALVLGRSARGLMGPEMVTVARFDDLADAVRDGAPAWMAPATAAAFGVPEGMSMLVVGLLAAGENLGVLLLVFDERPALTQSQEDLLKVAAGVIALALVRERVAGELQDP